MTRTARLVIGWAAVVGLTAAVWGLSRYRVARDLDDHGVVRLAWSARPERIETCRPPTAEEDADVLAHMRQAEICEGTTAAYRVTLEMDGAMVLDQAIHGGGLRHDRPIYFFHEVETAPGEHRVTVRFERADDDGGLAPRDTADQRRPIPRSLVLDTAVTIPSRTVLLVTYNPDQERLVLRQPEGYPQW